MRTINVKLKITPGNVQMTFINPDKVMTKSPKTLYIHYMHACMHIQIIDLLNIYDINYIHACIHAYKYTNIQIYVDIYHINLIKTTPIINVNCYEKDSLTEADNIL